MATTQVIVMWKYSADGDPYVLSYHDGARVYDKDCVESRACFEDKQPPFFSNIKDALAHVESNLGPRGACQLDAREAKRVGLL